MSTQEGWREKGAGHAFVADAGGRLGGKQYSSSSARGRGKGREGRGQGGRKNHKDREKEQQKAASGRAGGGKADREKMGRRGDDLQNRLDQTSYFALILSR